MNRELGKTKMKLQDPKKLSWVLRETNRESRSSSTPHRGNIDAIKGSKQAMDISQITQLPDGSQPKCVLLEEVPGVGKSTFA